MKLGVGSHLDTYRVQYTPDVIANHNYSNTNLVAWYDFNDASTMFENSGGTDAAESGDSIQYVTNKAYDGLAASSVSLNSAIVQSSATSSLQPVWTNPAKAPGYLTFTGTEELKSSITDGRVASGKMGGVTFNQQNFTVSIVIDADNAAETANHYYFGFQDQSRNSSALGLEERDDQIFWFPNVTSAYLDSDTATSTNLEFWTIVGGIPSVTGGDSARTTIYKNGVNLASNTTVYSSYNRDLTVNDINVRFSLGFNTGSTDRFEGKFYEYVQYDKALSDEQLDQLNHYYGLKYGISWAYS